MGRKGQGEVWKIEKSISEGQNIQSKLETPVFVISGIKLIHIVKQGKRKSSQDTTESSESSMSTKQPHGPTPTHTDEIEVYSDHCKLDPLMNTARRR